MAELAETTTRRSISNPAGYELVVVGNDDFVIHAVPDDGELVIGRSSECDVKLDSEGVSRRHAILRAAGDRFSVEDLDSANGTRLRGARAPAHSRIELSPGESFQLGDLVLVLQARRSGERTRHVWSHEYFEARLTEQCERARELGGRAFFVLRVRLEGGGDHAVQVVARDLRPGHVLARLYGVGLAVLVLDDTAAGAAELAAAIRRGLEEVGVQAEIRVFAYPGDGTSVDSLLGALLAPAAADQADAEGPVPLTSPRMIALYKQIAPIARGTINVLLLGETGVGKDVTARFIHERSQRSDGPFLRLNCASLSATLLETELFGHEKGAFTGAVATKAGLLESAHGGTVFLDEIGEFPLELQPKLLQVIENLEVLRVGSVRPRALDVRFVAATNRDLEKEAATGRFRSDLFYRLAGFTAFIPPLRERREDILALVDHFMRSACRKMRIARSPGVSDEAANHLESYAWPGNIRELRNVIERAVALSGGDTLTVEHLPTEKMRSVVLVDSRADTQRPVLDLTADEVAERQRIVEALTRSGGNQSQAAQLLGISRSTLIHKLDAYRIPRPRKRPGVNRRAPSGSHR